MSAIAGADGASAWHFPAHHGVESVVLCDGDLQLIYPAVHVPAFSEPQALPSELNLQEWEEDTENENDEI